MSQLLKLRADNEKLPTHRVILDGKEHFFFEEEMYEAFVEKNKIEELEALIHAVANHENGAADGNGNGNGHAEANGKDTRAEKKEKKQTKAELDEKKGQARRRLEKNEELHENKKIEELIGELAKLDLPIEDYYLRIEETDSGEKLRTRYVIENGDEHKVDVAGLSDIVGEIHKLAKQGMEVGRFKGLGEMNAEELWITTMDPQRRTLLRVTLEGASNAEAMFSTLMGEDVDAAASSSRPTPWKCATWTSKFVVPPLGGPSLAVPPSGGPDLSGQRQTPCRRRPLPAEDESPYHVRNRDPVQQGAACR